MKIYILCLFAMQLSVKCFSQTKKIIQESVIGRVYRKVDEINQFKGYKEVEGTMLGPVEEGYSLSNITNGVNTIIILQRIIHIDDKKVNYQILDTVNIGKIGQNKIVIMTGCLLNKKADYEIIGLVKNTQKETYTSILKAWRAKRKAGKIEKMPIKGVSCVDVNFASVD